MRRQTGAGTVAALILTCVFGATLLSSLTVGAGIYRRVEERAEESQNGRLGLTYLTAKIHGSDSAGAVSVGEFGGGDAVILTEELDGARYETILYVYDGWLMEVYREAGWALSPEDGQSITAARSMTVEPGENGLLTIGYTNGEGRTETAVICTRSAAEAPY